MADNENKPLPEEKKKSAWQTTKESWYDGVKLTKKQLDILVWCCFAALAVVFVLIGLEAAGIFTLF